MTLADQLRALGLGNYQGVDRAQELAEMLASQGITDFNQLKAALGQDGYTLTGNGTTLQHMDREGTGAKLTGALQKNGTQFGYSAAGEDGTEYYVTGVNPDGTPQIGIKSVSSNDGIHKLRDAGLLAGAAVGGAALLGGGAAGTAAAADPLAAYLTTGGVDGSIIGGAGGAGAVGGALSGPLTALNNAIPGAGNALLSAGTGIANAVGSKAGGAIAGALLGAAGSGDKAQEAKREPWEPAQPYLKGLLSDTKSLYEQQRQTPFNPVQSKYMNQLLGNVDYFNNMVAPGLLGWAGNIAAGSYNYDRRRPFTNQPIAARWGEGAAIPAANVNFNGLLGGK